MNRELGFFFPPKPQNGLETLKWFGDILLRLTQFEKLKVAHGVKLGAEPSSRMKLIKASEKQGRLIFVTSGHVT